VSTSELETISHQALTPRVAARTGQATMVEQSRAVAEVQAAIVVAQNCPRSLPRALAQMRESCAQPALAERAFFRFPRAGQTVSGPSVHLARELARTWGNVQFGIAELVRDDDRGQSEMLAFAWDVETNTRSSNTFIVPHMRDTRDGAKQITDMRDIYENNANNGARRLREAIFSVLPPWFVEEAKDLCTKTLTDGGGKPLAQRVADAIRLYGAIGISQAQLEAKAGSAADKWTEHDVANLGVIYKSLQRGEVSRTEEFPDDRVTAADITGAPKTAAEPASPPVPPASDRPQATRSSLAKALARLPLGEAEDIGEFLAWKTSRAEAGTLADLSQEEIVAIDAYLVRMVTTAEGDTAAAAEAIWTEYRAASADTPA
jgi:hypothetical protein